MSQSQLSATQLAQLARPLELGELLDRIFFVYRARFSSLMGWVGGLLLVQYSLLLALRWGGDGSINQVFEPSRGLEFGQLSLMLPALLVFLLLSAVVFSLVFFTMILLVNALYRGQVLEMHAAILKALKRWPSMLALMILIIGFAGVMIGVFIAGISLCLNLLSPLWGLVASGVFIFMWTLALLGCVVAHVLAPQIVLLENKGWRQALSRSRQLIFHNPGTGWADLGTVRISLSFLILSLVEITTRTVAFLFLIPRLDPGFTSIAGLLEGLHYLTMFASSTLTMPLYGLTLTVIYFDLRIRREGLDLELLGTQQAT